MIEIKQLIEQIKKGDKVAFRELFNRYYKILLATAINIVQDVNTAKDIVQEVFLQIWKNHTTLKIKTNPEGYLKRAVVNRALNFIKARKPMVPEDSLQNMHSHETQAQQVLEASDLEKEIQKALMTLPERCRMVFVLKRMKGLSLKEIAQKLDTSPKTAENQITKALKVLKEVARPFLEENRNSS